MRSRVAARIIVVALVSSGIGLIAGELASAEPAVARVSSDAMIPSAVAQQAFVEQTSPFPLFELPSTAAVVTRAEAPDNPAGGTYSADQSYAVGSDVVHVWQTNNADLGAKDPTSQPDATAVQIAGTRWWQSSVSGEPTDLWMAMRTASGITVEIDGEISLSRLESLAASLAQNQGK